jgi:hypothetical protein
MVTFFGLGVLARLLVSEEMRTAGIGTCVISPSEVRPAVMEATIRVPLVTMDGRPPCAGQAEPRAVATESTGLLTPGTSLWMCQSSSE